VNQKIKVLDLEFTELICAEDIQRRIAEMALEITARFQNERPIILGVLNGVIRFAADLIANLDFELEIEFVKVASYHGGLHSSTLKPLIGISPEIVSNRPIIILEDIIDTGNTIRYLLDSLSQMQCKSIFISTLVCKPDKFLHDFPIDQIGFSIPDRFVIGYGLDYEGLARNLNSIYQLKS
jgi:hypoxanthine phosphoribosyltransferase